MNNHEIEELANVIFSALKPLNTAILTADHAVSDAQHHLFGFDGHNEASYQYCAQRMEKVRTILAEIIAHVTCVATNVPTHARLYCGGQPNHIKELRAGKDEWN